MTSFRMVLSTVFGVLMLVVGVILSTMLGMEVWILNIFLVVVIILSLLEIARRREYENIFYGIIYAVLIGAISALNTAELPMWAMLTLSSSRAIALAAIVIGIKGFFSFFTHHNHSYALKEN